MTDQPTPTIPRRFGVAVMLLGVALAGNSLLGPFVLDAIDYPVSASMRNQTIGLDAAALFVIAPCMVAIGWIAVLGHRSAALLALGPTAYTAYMFVQYLAGPDHLNYPPVLPLQLAIFGGSWLLAGWAWNLTKASVLATPRPRHGVAVTIGLAAFVALRYIPGLIGAATNEALPVEAATDPAMYWLIFSMDLGIFVPVAIVAGIGLAKRQVWAPPLFVALIVWFALVTVAVTAMSLTMTINDDINASTPQLLLFAATSALVLPYTYRALVSLRRPAGPQPSTNIPGRVEF